MTNEALRQRAIWAVLIDKFGLRPWEIGRLTQRQIHELYFHPRNKDGTIKFPSDAQNQQRQVPATLEGELAALDEFAAFMGAGWKEKQQLDAAKEQLRAKYDGQRPDDTGLGGTEQEPCVCADFAI